MRFEEIQTQWASDARIDKASLTDESLKIPLLHAKYYEMYVQEKLKLTNLKAQVVELEHILEQYYAKTLTASELKEYGLEYIDKTVLKTDIPKWVQSNRDNIKLKQKVAVQQEKVDFLKSILQQISTRSFAIRDAIEFLKFQSGG